MARLEFETHTELPGRLPVMESNARKLGMTDAATTIAEESQAISGLQGDEILALPRQHDDPQAHIRYAVRSLGFWETAGAIGAIRLTDPKLDVTTPEGLQSLTAVEALVTGIDNSKRVKRNGKVFSTEEQPLPSSLPETNAIGQGNAILIFDPSRRAAQPSGPDKAPRVFPGQGRR